MYMKPMIVASLNIQMVFQHLKLNPSVNFIIATDRILYYLKSAQQD